MKNNQMQVNIIYLTWILWVIEFVVEGSNMMHLQHTVYEERQTSQSGQVSKQRWIASWVVVSNIFHVHPYLGKILKLTNIFQMGWNHHLASVFQYWPISIIWMWSVVMLTAWLVNLSDMNEPQRVFLDHATLGILPLPSSHLRARFNAIWVIPNSWYVTMRIYFQAQGQDPGSGDGWKIWSSKGEEWILLYSMRVWL